MLARLKNLLGNLAVYGLGDVATSLVSLLLLPVYTRYLSRTDYGVLALLVTIEAVAKIAFRWGADTAFMRLYYDCEDVRSRQRLASTIFFFLLAANGALVAVAVFGAGWFGRLLFGSSTYTLLIALSILNTFLNGFFFMPFQILRIGERAGQFTTLTFASSAGTLLLRLVLVIAAGMGVKGIVFADVIVTCAMALVLTQFLAPLIRLTFSRDVLREVLAFGLPRIPHSLAQQVMGLADRYFLNAYATLSDVGLYSIGVTFGLTPKYFLSAFDFAWAPFFLGAMAERNAKRIYSTISTYIVAILVLIVMGLTVVSPDLIRLATTQKFHGAAPVIPWIALGALFQGLNLVGSIGIIITKQTKLYPLTTGCAAAVGLLANGLLVPRYGMMGAAWAFAIAYGALALVTVGFSLRSYPIPYEWGRLSKLAIAGLAAYVITSAVVSPAINPWLGLLVRGTLGVAIYLAVLFLTKFFHAGEFRVLNDVRRRGLQLRNRRAAEEVVPIVEDDPVL